MLCRVHDKFQLSGDSARCRIESQIQSDTQRNRFSIGRECKNSTSGATKEQDKSRKVELEGKFKERNPVESSANEKGIYSSSVQPRELLLLAE